MSELVGYARVSTGEQNLESQKDALEKYGCLKIFEDYESGAKEQRPGLDSAIAYLRPGDTFVVCAMDRLARSLHHIVTVVKALGDRGVEFTTLRERIDTSTPGGRFQMQLFAALAELELALIRDRTRAGLAAARARGRFGGRPHKLDAKKIATGRALVKDPTLSVRAICEVLEISASTYYRYLPNFLSDGRGSGRIDSG